MDGRGGEVDPAIGKYISLLTLCSCCNVRISCLYNAFVCIPGEERADHGRWIFDKLRHGSLSDHPATVRTCTRSHLDDPVCLRKDLSIMVHQKDRIAVCDEIVHHAVESDNI